MATNKHTVNDTNWRQFKKMAMTTWHRLTDDDFNDIKGNLEMLETRLQDLYGLTKERAMFEIEGVVKKFTQSILNVTESANEKLTRASEHLKPSKTGDSLIQTNSSQTPTTTEILSQSNPFVESLASDAPIFLKPNGGSVKKKVIKQNVNADVRKTGPKHPEVRHH